MTDFLNEMRNKATKPIVDSIKNKANWSYHPLTKSYTLIGAYDLKFFTFAELSALFKKHLNKELIASRMVNIQSCDCYAICNCQKMHELKFKE